MAGRKVRSLNKIFRADIILSKTKIWHCNSTGFFWIIWKISLNLKLCVVSYNLDGIFVSSDCTITAKPPEYTFYRILVNLWQLIMSCVTNYALLDIQWKPCHIILYPYCESFFVMIGIYSHNLFRSRILRAKTVTSSIHRDIFKFTSF